MDKTSKTKEQELTCVFCHQSVPAEQTERVVVKGKEHVACHECLAEQEAGVNGK